MNTLKSRIDNELNRIKLIAENEGLGDLRESIKNGLAKAKVRLNEDVDRIEAINAEVDPVADEFIERVRNSKYTVLIICAWFLFGLSVGVLFF